MGRPTAPRGDAVKQVRQKLNLTQPEKAALIGIDKAKISYLEKENVLPSGDASLKTLKKLARRHGVPLKGGAKA